MPYAALCLGFALLEHKRVPVWVELDGRSRRAIHAAKNQLSPGSKAFRVVQVVQVVPPGASGASGVTGGATGWYGRATGAARQYRSVPPRDESFPRSTACTTCTPFRVHRSLSDK
jgi:hypothetical protein